MPCPSVVIFYNLIRFDINDPTLSRYVRERTINKSPRIFVGKIKFSSVSRFAAAEIPARRNLKPPISILSDMYYTCRSRATPALSLLMTAADPTTVSKQKKKEEPR
jgi:hypothetical protein